MIEVNGPANICLACDVKYGSSNPVSQNARVICDVMRDGDLDKARQMVHSLSVAYGDMDPVIVAQCDRTERYIRAVQECDEDVYWYEVL